MVKGISRQVIVVHSPDPKLFDQAIFILREDAVSAGGVTDEALLKEAQRIMAAPTAHRGKKRCTAGPLWAFGGAAVTGVCWLLSLFF